MASLPLRLPQLPLFVLLAIAPLSAQVPAAPPQAAPTLTVQGLGNATATLGGPWQFHLGDDMRWTQPSIDDITGHDGWETISADKPWGEQAHFAYAGYGWYRRHIDFLPVSGARQELALIVPPLTGPYQVYWNGNLIGQAGKMPPGPDWGWRTPPHSFGLGQVRSGVLALRIWEAPFQFPADGFEGGLGPAPLAGSVGAVKAFLGSQDHAWLADRQFYFDENLLYLILALLGLLAWLRNRSQNLLLWVSLFALMQPAHVILYNAHMPFPFQISVGFDRVVECVEDLSLWFLLLYLLELDQNAALRRWTRGLAGFNFVAGLIDWFVISRDWSSSLVVSYQIVDAVLALAEKLTDAFPLVLILFALRKRLPFASWLVAITATVYELIGVVAVASIQGQRFTHWTVVYNVFRYRVFTIHGNYFDPANIAITLLFFTIIYAVYRYTVDQSERHAVLETEFKNARELQHVLIPEDLPEIPGFALTSAYQPAHEVGGDFFQIIPIEDGSTLVVLGDVSGKGLKAAMAVSLIVGAARTLAESTNSPAEMLAGLNRRLHGRLRGGFATCVAMRIGSDGSCVIASAGHPAPFVNDHEISLPGALPLGITLAASYEEMQISLQADDRLALYTDGLLEARCQNGELYGFARLQSLFAARPEAAQAAEAAVQFGQDDDITVLMLTRLSPSEMPSAARVATASFA